MTGTSSYPESDGIVKAVRDIIEANNDFREGMPADWGGDPLQDAIDAAAKLLLGVAQEAKHCGDDDDRMERISALISRLQSTLDQWGDTCVYIRRGGLSWGAVALNRQDDDRKYGVFDLQAQHDRDMEQRVGQVERLIADRNRWMERAMAAEASPVPSTDKSGAA